jgi:nucleoside-diphosphate-sugar epimerase
VNPPFFYGPFTAHFPLPTPDFGALSTDVLFYNLLFPDGVFPGKTRYIDVRDVAQAHVRALNSRPTAEVGRKRIILSSPFGWPFQQTVDFLAEQRPALKGRLITATPQVQPFDVLPMDFGRVEEVLGMKVSDFHTVEQVGVNMFEPDFLLWLTTSQTTLDTVDALLQVEELWRSAGYPIKTPPAL